MYVLIVPAQPKLRGSPPIAEGWLHEIKLDGWWNNCTSLRTAALFSKAGCAFARKFPCLPEPYTSFVRSRSQRGDGADVSIAIQVPNYLMVKGSRALDSRTRS
jgi:hypothetical protein